MVIPPNLNAIGFSANTADYPVGSDVWWISRLLAKRTTKPVVPKYKVGDSRRSEFQHAEWLEYLWNYRTGAIPLIGIAEKYATATREFLRMSKVQFPATIVDSLLDRVQPIGARIVGSEVDTDGDDDVRHFIDYNGSFIQDAEDFSLTFGVGYVLIGSGWDGKSDDTGTAIATGEDPRNFYASLDPFHPGDVRAALKFFYDEELGRQTAAVYVRDDPNGEQHEHVSVWYRESDSPVVGFDPSSWTVDTENSQDLIQGAGLPVIALPNRRGIGEFEEHLDLIDRIINGISDRIWAAKYQIFKQRVIIGEFPPSDPETGVEIDYDAIFQTDPSALWRLPPDSQVWESSQLSINELIQPYINDIKELAMVSRTPFPIIASDSANQSASGVDLYKDGIGFKAEDRQKRWGPQIAKMCRLGLLYSGKDDPGDMEPMWAPVERESVLSKGQAASAIYATGAPAEGVWSDILDLPPATIQRWRQLAAKEQLLGTRVTPSSPDDQNQQDDNSIDDQDQQDEDVSDDGSTSESSSTTDGTAPRKSGQ